MPSPNITNLITRDGDLQYLTWTNDAEKKAVFEEFSASVGQLKNRSLGYVQSFTDIDSNVSVPPEFNRRHFEYFRPGQTLPVNKKDRMKRANEVYRDVGIIRNIIDLMADFAVQGVKLSHPQESVQKFYRKWAEKVNLRDVAERFMNTFYRLANVVIKIEYGLVRLKQEQFEDLADKISDKKVPISYNFLNPVNLEVMGGQLSTFAGKHIYAINLPRDLRNKINNPTTRQEKELIALLPQDIKDAAKSGQDLYPLNMEQIRTYFYKKDDWEVWADPMVTPILKDINLLERLKLADAAACDGIISQIRIWKLGNLEKGILPKPAAFARLAALLENNVGGGSKDLLWGPDIELIESKSEAYNFLGEKKYEAPLNAIYGGLGIPPLLTGTQTTGGFSNNYISLKTLVERLEYGRAKLTEFLDEQISIIQKEMGFQKPATVQFEKASLSDEATIKAIYIQMWDRDIISTESFREIFGISNDIEDKRIERQIEAIEDGDMPEKASPYHKAGFDNEVKMKLLEVGAITPEQAGVEIEGKVKISELQPSKQKPKTPPGKSGQGRPKTSTDKTKRKQKKVKVRTKAGLISIWAKEAQEYIAEEIMPAVLDMYKISNARKLTEEQAKEVEEFKFKVLCSLAPMTQLNDENLDKAISDSTPLFSLAQQHFNIYKEELEKVVGEVSVLNIREIQRLAYLDIQELDNVESDD